MKTTLFLLLSLGLVHNVAASDDLRRCRAIGDDAQRLACYDAISVGETGTASAPPIPVAANQAAPAPEPAPAAQFGLERKVQAKQEAEVTNIESTIAGRVDGWRGSTRFTLANGQVWQIADGSQGFYRLDNPRVEIRRGLFGSFYMKLEGANHAPKVKRLK